MLTLPSVNRKRITKELEKELKNGNIYKLRQIDENNLVQLLMTIKSPDDLLYLGMRIEILLHIPIEYPFNPPKVTILTKIRHLKISPTTGAVNIKIIHDSTWSPALTLHNIATLLCDDIFKYPTIDSIECASHCCRFDGDLIDVAKRSIPEYCDIVKCRSRDVISGKIKNRPLL